MIAQEFSIRSSHDDRSRLRGRFIASVLLLATIARVTPLEAQSKTLVIVAGVADADTGAPLPDALVRLPDLGRAARTDWIGEARIGNVRPGEVRIEVRKLGYAPADITLPVRGDSVGPVFMLTRSTAVLDTITVFGQVVPRRLREFEARRHMGIGRFVTDSVLEREGNRSLALVLSMRFPGIRAVQDLSSPNHYKLQSMRFGTTISRGAQFCSVDVYLDGMLYLEDIDALHPSEVAGVEFYSMESAPPQYRRGTGSCQVVLIWSKF